MKITTPNITPGEFTLTVPPSSNLTLRNIQSDDTGQVIAEITRHSWEMPIDESLANARFLAASKKMAEALLTIHSNAAESVGWIRRHALTALESAGYTFAE